MLRKLAVPVGLVALCALLVALPVVAQQITDAAEYNVYIAAINETDPVKQIAAIDAYLAKYPKSAVKEQAIDVKLSAQQKANLPSEQTARDLLAVNPNNARAELVLSFTFKNNPPAETDPNFAQKLSDEDALAKRAIEHLATLKKPDNVDEATFQKNKNLVGSTHYQAIALIGALRKDNNGAIEAYKKAASLTPDDGTIFYQIGQAYDRIARATTVEADKEAAIQQEMWYFARAVSIDGLNPAGKTQVDAYLANVYKRFHGSDEGLQQLKDAAKTATAPPADFHVKTKLEMTPPPPPPPPPPPIPDDVTKMSFSQIKEVLSAGGDKAAEVFGKLKGVPMGLDGIIVSHTGRTVKLAVSKATQETADAYDVVLTLTALPARPLPKGKSVEFEGTPKEFVENPFSLVMTGGKVTLPAAPRPGKK